MIYIGTSEYDGSAIHFDIHAIERAGRGLRVSGTVGDSGYEGEVLVEVGGIEEVTFVDAWLGGEGFREFLQRCDATRLERSLLDAVSELPALHMRRPAPHGYAPHAAGAVAEPAPSWSRSA